MGYRRKIGGLLLSGVMAAVVTVGLGGTAHATITNPTGYTHMKVGDSGKCLMADADTGAVEEWRCLNAASEEWQVVPVTEAGHPYIILVSHWTNQCMSVPSWPVNGTKVVQAPCDATDVREYWREDYLNNGGPSEDGPNYHIVSLQGALCLDKPDGDNSDGLQMQTWACASQDPNWNPFFDYHYEQWWSFI